MTNVYSLPVNSRFPRLNTTGFSRLWWATAIGGVAAMGVIAILPVDSFQRSLLARGVGLAATLLFFIAFRSLPKAARRIWIWVGAFLVITVVADMIFDYQALILDVRPFPGITDVLYLAAFACAITGLIALSRRLNPVADLTSWIDISIMVIAASALIGAFVIESIWSDGNGFGVSKALDLLYPLLSLALLAAIVRLIILPHPRNTAIKFVAASGLCFLICDLIFSNQLIVGRTPVVAIEVLWAAAIIFLALAAMSPGASLFVPVDETIAHEVTPTRRVLICVSVIAVPAAVLLELILTGTLIANWLLPVIVVLVALVLLRLHLLLGTSQRQATALASLARTDSLTGLPNKHTWDQLVQEQSSRIAPTSGVCTIVMLDIDNFAQHRDGKTHNHADLMLVSLSLSWLGELRADDLLARWGSDEFALMIHRESVAEAQEVLRRVLRATPAGLTVSVGAALLRPKEDPADAERRAWSALHAAMSGGREQRDVEQHITS